MENQFLQSIKQIEIAAVLMRKKDDGKLESVFASESFAKLMECSSTEEAMKMMNGEGFTNTTHTEDRPKVYQMLNQHFSKQNTKDLIIRKISAKGKIIWCNVHYAFIDDFDEDYLYCTYFDVTTLRISEQRLKKTYQAIGETFYRENSLTLGMFRVNLKQNKIEDMKGRDLFDTDSIDRSFSEVIKLRALNYPIAREQKRFLKVFNNQKLITDYLAGKTQLSEFLFSRRKDGRLCYVNFAVMLTRHPLTNEITAFIAEKEANHQKVESALLDKILARQFDMVAYLANGKYGVVAGDASLIEKGSIFPLTRIGDYDEYLKNQVVPVLDENLKSETIEALSLKNIKANVKTDKPYIVNIACNIDGEKYYKRFDFYNVDPEADFYILLKSDTTEIQRKQIEQNERLREALKEARQANVAKTAFLSRMSHEIRTPMNAIIGLDKIALHDPNLSDNLRSHLDQIGQSARYLLSLINDILDMSRIESGKMAIKNEEFEFNSFLDQIKSMIESQCREKNLKFSCNILTKLNQFYIGDDTKLKQILINILGNSVKFTNSGGEITLNVECTAQYEGQSNFRFTMKDTGIGMDKEYLPKIFDAFTQEDATTTSNFGGSGLGLAITKNIVEMMNGSISVDSAKGIGTTFIVNLPLKNSTRRSDQTEEFNPRDLNVLIIDDDPLSCTHAKTLLNESGINADTCESGKKAFEMIRLHQARREEYNLILVDFQMPFQNGLEVTKEIRKILDKNTTVIMITAFDTFELEDKAIEAGADAIMEKPLSIASLTYELQQIFKRKKSEVKEKILADLTNRRVLIAEDMPVNAEIMMMLLSMREMQTEHAENGKIAVEMFAKSEKNYYDAVLMDIRMPEMDGLEATMAIRALDRPDAKTIPIIAMTANAFDEDVQRSLQAGMNAHLTKPVEPENLFRTLEELIGKNLANQ
ncbi:MAG: response regulator [Selenomonadaceae bacterium]|nr:response regulator [Selenomonadaceae bacterium]